MELLQSWKESLKIPFSRQDGRLFFSEFLSTAFRIGKLLLIYQWPLFLAQFGFAGARYFSFEISQPFALLLIPVVIFGGWWLIFSANIIIFFADKIHGWGDLLHYCNVNSI